MNHSLSNNPAHRDAYVDAKIIHRDISAGNIILVQDEEGNWTGMLNDWELSKRVEGTRYPNGRQPDRTVRHPLYPFRLANPDMTAF